MDALHLIRWPHAFGLGALGVRVVSEDCMHGLPAGASCQRCSSPNSLCCCAQNMPAACVSTHIHWSAMAVLLAGGPSTLGVGRWQGTCMHGRLPLMTGAGRCTGVGGAGKCLG